MISATELGLTDGEQRLLWHGTLHWGGPADVSDGGARLVDYDSAEAMLRGTRTVSRALHDGQPLSTQDWWRALFATELVFSSAVYGLALDWEIVTGRNDEHDIRALRSIQHKFYEHISADVPEIRRSAGRYSPR